MRLAGPDGTIAEIEIGDSVVIVPEVDDHVVGRGGARGQIGRGWEEREAPMSLSAEVGIDIEPTSDIPFPPLTPAIRRQVALRAKSSPWGVNVVLA